MLGRTFLPEDGQSEKSNPVAVLSYQFWQQRLNSDQNILGKSLILNATPFTVVGIAPREFVGSGDPPAVPDVWIPLAMQPYIVPGSHWLNDANAYNVRMVGRLKSGMALKEAQAILREGQSNEKDSEEESIEPMLQKTCPGTCCSPCFNRYMEILANLTRRKAAGQ